MTKVEKRRLSWSEPLRAIADASPYFKIQAIDNYINDLTYINVAKVEAILKSQYPVLPVADIRAKAIDQCQAILWDEFRDLLKTDTYYWSLVNMKHQMMNVTPDFHLDTYDALINPTKKYKCFVRFRGSAKTAQKTNDILHNVTECLEPLMVMISSAAGLASIELIEIKAEIESNEVIRYIYGDLKGLGTWNTKVLECANGICIIVKGVTSQIRGTKWKGQRPTKVYLDDFEDEKNADTDDKRAALVKWFSAQIKPIGDVDMQTIMFGTIVHPDAYLAKVDPKWDEETKTFKNPNSIFGGTKGYYSRIDIADANGNPTWGERYNREWIEDERKSHEADNTLSFFYQEYYNIPAQESNPIIDVKMITELNGIYKEEYGVQYIEVYAPEDKLRFTPIKKIPINVFVGVDPTRATRASSDDFVMAAIGVANNKNIILLDFYARVVLIKDQAAMVVDFLNKWKPQHATIETYGYQLALHQYVENLLELEGNGNHHTLWEFNENKSKKAKYKESLCNPIANGYVSRLTSCGNWDKFFIQAAKFSGGETEKDDCLDGATLAMHENEKDGKMLWGPYIDDVDAEINKARIRFNKANSKKKRKTNFMGM